MKVEQDKRRKLNCKIEKNMCNYKQQDEKRYGEI